MNKQNNLFKAGAAALSLMLGLTSLGAAESEPGMDVLWGEQKTVIKKEHPSLEWFTHDKYAMFIHWGLYSRMGGVWDGKTHYGIGEWIMHMADIPVDDYKAYASQFNPQQFDAKAIARVAKAAGMKTLVITSKHHEGFAMFDSKASDFTITSATPFGRDPMKELADACREEGIRFGFYYSQNIDWTEPYGGRYRGERPEGYTKEDFSIYFENKVIPQVTELLTNYGDIAVIWFDTPGGMPAEYSAQLVELVTTLQPGCLINSRIGGGYGDYVSLGDMHVPPLRPDVGVWETVDTTNDSWSYAWYDQNWKSPKTICERLIQVVARGGSYMLNVGPNGDGMIPEKAVHNLELSGEWIHAHGEAIYGAGASPFDQGFSWGDITTKGNDLYLHVFDWPSAGVLRLAYFGAKVKSATLLENASSIEFTQNGQVVELTLGSPIGRDLPFISVVKLRLEAPAQITNQAKQVDGIHSVTVLAEMAELEGCIVKERRWMEKFGEWKHDYYVQDWECNHSKATWDINVLEAGDYLVTLEYSSENAAQGSEWVLTCAEENITFVTYESGYDSTNEFQHGPPRQRNFTTTLGVLNIPETGLNQLQVTPRNILGEGIGVKGITLTPYK